MNTTEDECAKCGSTLEEVRPGKWQCTKCELDRMMADQYNAGYQAGLSKAQRDNDDAFWIRQYAGYAMQGILAHEGYTDNDPYMGHAVKYAKALLEEAKKHETTNQIP